MTMHDCVALNFLQVWVREVLMPHLLDPRSLGAGDGPCITDSASPLYMLCDSSPQGGPRSGRDWFLAEMQFVATPVGADDKRKP